MPSTGWGTESIFGIGSPTRALRWAHESSALSGRRIKSPAVIGAIIDLGHCLNLIDPENTETVRQAYRDYITQCEASGIPPLRNKGTESRARFLDCAVMNFMHKLREEQNQAPFDTVRGFFIEGDPVYPTAGLRSLDHVQICVRDPGCILGFFRPNLVRSK